MATITAQMVKELRDKTDAGMMDCKKALTEADGDMDKAVDLLRKAGIAKAAKKAGRAATEGTIVALIEQGRAVLVEVLCETDFVARNEKFSAYARDLAQRVLADDTLDGDVGETVGAAEEERVGELVAAIGENIQVRRVVRWTGAAQFGSYLHMGGRIGVLVEAEGADSPDLLPDICMHIAAFSPRYVTPGDIPEDVLAKEREIAEAQVQGKPENIIGRIVMGKIAKWQKEVCLTQQPWLRDDKSSLGKVAPGLTVKGFLRWAVGEEV